MNGLEELPKRYLPMRDPPSADRDGVRARRSKNSILAKERTDTAALAYTDMFSTMLGKPEEADD